MASLAFPTLAKKTTLSDGTTYGFVRVHASASNPTLLFLHGYPSSSYDWRHQIEYFSGKGYGLIVPDLLGYGDTSKPSGVKAYTMRTIGRQVDELLQQEGLDKVVGIAHDWGCGLLSSMARRHAERFSSFVFSAVGYLARQEFDIDQINAMMEKMIGYPPYGYWKFHDEEGAADVIAANSASYNSILYPADPEIWKTVLCPIGKIREWIESGKVAPRADWLSEEDILMHEKVLGMGGYAGPLNWYKQMLHGHAKAEDEDLKPEDLHLRVPTLYIRAEKDYVCLPDPMEGGMKEWVTDLHVASLDASHWLQVEKPDEFNKILEGFVTSEGKSSL